MKDLKRNVIENIEQLAKLPSTMHESKNMGELCWWRGHGNEKWDLTPSVYRKSKEGEYEYNILRWFQTQAPIRHEKIPSANDHFQWLALAQHHRLPTRLLDWSQSIFVATYFAVNDRSNSSSAIWCLNPSQLNASEMGSSGLCLPFDDPIRELSGLAFNDYSPFGNDNRIQGLNNEQIKEFISSRNNVTAAVVPPSLDLRMLQQLAMFTIHGNNIPLQEKITDKRILRKYIIPAESKKNIRHNLNCLGFTSPNLFPDLDHLSDFLANRDFSYDINN